MTNIDLSPRPRGRAHLSDWYAAALEAQSTSGLSMADYADQLGVAPATLYHWKRRLLSEGESAEFETPASLGLVELTVDDQPSDNNSGPIVVRLGSRCVELPPRFDDEDLIRLIEILEAC